MTSPRSNPAFLTLFASQVASLVAVGLLTVALAPAACRTGLAAARNALGPLQVLKLVGHVVIAPLAEALLRGMPRKSAMIGLGLGRVLLLVPMAFVATMLRIATLTFASFVLAPAFTTLYQSVVPDVPPETVTFALALARSWIAYALEAALGPAISAALLGVKWAEHLFPAAALALVGSILARLATRFPARAFGDGRKPILERAVIGLRICSHTPRIRCPVLLNLALMLASAWVLVKSVVFVGLRPGDAGKHHSILMALHGLGAVSGAVLAPTMVRHLGERMTMMLGALGIAAPRPAILCPLTLAGLLVRRAGAGLTASLVLTPGGLETTRSTHEQDRPTAFAAQLSLSRAGWLLACPLAGCPGIVAGLEPALVSVSGLAAVAGFAATRVWPVVDPLQRTRGQRHLTADHPQLRDAPMSGPDHAHLRNYHFDDLHPGWAGSTA